MKRKHGASGGGRGGGRGGRGGGRQGGGRRGGRGDRSKRTRNYADYEPQPEVKAMQATEGNVSSEEEEEYEEPISDYTALLQTLQATNETFAKAYAPRRREEQGGGESSEDDEEAGSELEDEDGVELNSELDGETAEEGVEDAEGEEEEENVENGDAEDDDASSESEWEEVVDGEKVETGETEEEKTDEDSDSEMLSSKANAGTCEDPFKKHLEAELSDAKIAELVEGKAKFKTEVNAAGLPTARWLSNISTFPKVEKDLSSCAVKERLLKHWQGRTGHKQFGDFHSEGQAQFFALCNSYEDILFTQRCGPHGSVASNEEHQTYVDAYVMHILNHVLKTRDLVTRNNEKLQRQQTASSENGKQSADFIDPPRDQGFTRPKVLILLPLRSTALKFVKKLIELAPKSQTVDIEHKARFFDDFGVEDDEDDVEEENHDGGEGEQEDSSGYKGGKPEDFKALFSGNNDDHFRLGLKLTRKSIKLYSEFYSSDIIVASPLGLITQIGEAESAKKENNKDVDFLSSIEIVVVDYTDVIWMQNWQHVLTLFDHLNRIPQSQHGTDFMRIREWCLNGHSRHYRQTLILSTFPDAKINAFFHRSCVNHSGKVKLKTEYPGVLSKVMLKIRQVYERIDCKAITEVYDARFDHFTKQVFPRIKDSHQGGILLFASSFDVRRIGNFLKAQSASFCELSEYTKQSDISRSRSWFYHKKRHIMLYTERAHFYHRYKIRGITELIFYSLPDHAQFYTEIANLLGGFSSCTVLFSKFDNFQLERIVGSTYARRMLEAKQATFTFM